MEAVIRTAVYLPLALKDRAKALARRENRSLNNLIVHLLTRYLEEKEKENTHDQHTK